MNFLIGIGGLIFGAVATIFVARYYYKRSINKRLNIYLHFATGILDGIDPNTSSDINLSYRGTTIDDIFQLQFFIANEGDRPIHDLLEPLSLKFPENVRVLDANILYVNPPGRKISITRDSEVNNTNLIIFDIPLLNSGEFFLTKILLEGSISTNDLQFNLSVDDLPPIIKPQPLPFHSIRSKWHSHSYFWISIAIGLFYFFIATSLLNVIYIVAFKFGIQFTAINSITLTMIGIGAILFLLKAWETAVTFGISEIFNKPLFDLPKNITSWQWEIMKSVEREKSLQSIMKKWASSKKKKQ